MPGYKMTTKTINVYNGSSFLHTTGTYTTGAVIPVEETITYTIPGDVYVNSNIILRAGTKLTYNISSVTGVNFNLSQGNSAYQSFNGTFNALTILANSSTPLLVQVAGAPVTYNITYVGTSGATGTFPSTYTFGITLTLTSPSRPGYSFAGWTPSATIASGNSGPKTITATWTALPYTVAWTLPSGITNDSRNPLNYTTGSNIPFYSVSRTGYNFSYFEETQQGFGVIDGIEPYMYGNMTVAFVYTPINYAITYYNLNTGTQPNPTSYNIETPTISLMPSVRTGYTYGGWFNDAAFTSSRSSIALGTTGAISLYVKWTPTTYYITYTNLGGGSQSNPTTYNIETPTITLTAATRTGYTFDGWFTNSSYTTQVTQIPLGSVESRVLYAKWTAIEYTITYVLNGGTNHANNPTKYSISTATFSFGTPTKAGYTFGGWFTNSELTTSITQIPLGSTGNQVIWAKWIPTTYNINYNLDGGINAESNPYTFTIETPTITFAPPTRTGYTFGGWYTDEDLTIAITQLPLGSMYYRELWAKWTVITYNITYNLDGGTNSGSNPATFNINSTKITFAAPTRTGYTFVAWYSDSGLTTTITEIAAGSTGNKSVWAKWMLNEYAITYNLDGGTNNAGNPAKYSVTTSTFNFLNPTRTGYTFGGWYSNSGLTTSITQVAVGSTGNKEVWAKWTMNTYTITYYLDGGTNSVNNPANFTVTSAAITLLNPTRLGYTFGGWFTESTFTNVIAEIPMGSASNYSLWAKWSINTYYITYEVNGGLNHPSNVYEFKVNTPTITFLSATRTGYTFGGWYSDSGFTTQVTQIALGSVNNRTLYAKWNLNTYTITYTLNGGINDPSNKTSFTVEDPLINILPAARTGYTFDGWFDNSSFTGTVISTIPAGSITNRILYAKWTIIPYTITYNLDDGTNNAGNVSGYNVATPTITLLNPTKLGYTFGGWYSDSGLVTTITQIPLGSVGDRSVWAKWLLNTYTITYNLNGGTNDPSNPPNFTVTTNTITFSEPTRLGYTFGGWFADSGLTTAISQIPLGSVTNRTLWAKWSINTYAIAYESIGVITNTNPISYTIISSNVTLTTPARVGHTFSGFYHDQAFATPIANNLLVLNGQTGNKTVYLKWTINSGSISLINRYVERNGAIKEVEVSTALFDYDTTITLGTSNTNLLVKTKQFNYEYEFIGWSAKNDINNTLVDSFATPTFAFAGDYNNLIPTLGKMDAVLAKTGTYYAVWKRRKNGLKNKSKSVKIKSGSKDVKEIRKGNTIIWKKDFN